MRAAAVIVVRICVAGGCHSSGGSGLLQALRKAIAQATVGDGRNAGISVKGVGCLGPCGEGPVLAIDAPPPQPSTRLLGAAKPCSVGELAASLQAAERSGSLRSWSPPAARPMDQGHPFFTLQRRWVLERCGLIDPESIDEAMAAGAYRQLADVVNRRSPGAVIQAVVESALRGRGGAGFPTGQKWQRVASQSSPQKLVVCNADEGDPGAFMNRTVMEGDPHRLLEGIAIAAYAIGASRGYLYVRAEYPLAIARLRNAIAQAEALGWLGNAINGTAMNLQLELRVGAGAYVCGEETALIHSIEGQRGTPRPRPPYPAEEGVFGLPTLINNVETFANVPVLLSMGPKAYNGGTKVFCLTGQGRRCGVLEVPLGTTLHTIVHTMGGGAMPGRRLKAVLTGGPSGGCIRADQLDTPVDYESLKALGTILGSGGLVVLDDTTNLVDMATYFMGFCRDESCGKCVPCRAGTVQLHQLLQTILAKQAQAHHLEQLESLCRMVKETSLCGLGQNAPTPVLSSLRQFPGDYRALLATELEPEPEPEPEPQRKPEP